jgi:hypothetical protein
MDFQIFSSIGFGFCPPQTVQESASGGVELVYRYVPPALMDSEERKITGAFNQAGLQGALDESQVESLELEDFTEDELLTDLGLALFDRMPVYAILRVDEDLVEWEAYWEGKPAVTLRASKLDPLLDEALKVPPQQLWAQKHFAGITHYLYGADDPEAAVMPMAPGLDGEGEDGEDLPRVAVEERVEYPFGLWKIVLIAIKDEAVEEFRSWGDTEQFSVIDGSVGILRNGAFTYAPVPFIRWELPATLVPNVVQWVERENIKRSDPWAPLAVMPYYDWDSPVASIPMEAEEEAGLAAAYTVPRPPEDLDEEFQRWMEAEIKSQLE